MARKWEPLIRWGEDLLHMEAWKDSDAISVTLEDDVQDLLNVATGRSDAGDKNKTMALMMKCWTS